MRHYLVNFQYSETTYCSNIAKANSLEAVKAHYSKYAWVNISEASESDILEAERKGKPIIECADVVEAAELVETMEIVSDIETTINRHASEIYRSLADDMIHKKLEACSYIKSIKRKQLYNGYIRIIVTYSENVKRIYLVRSH